MTDTAAFRRFVEVSGYGWFGFFGFFGQLANSDKFV